MIGVQQKRLLLDVFENLPGLSFLVLSRATDDLQLTGWIGTILAMLVCIAYLRNTIRPHPILLGINLFMVVITPAIKLLFLAGGDSLAHALIGNIDSLVLASVFVTGICLTCFSRLGFLNYECETRPQMLRQSAALLVVSGLGLIWSVLAGDNYLMTLALPFMVMFGLLQLMRAGTIDRQSPKGAAALILPQQPTSDPLI